MKRTTFYILIPLFLVTLTASAQPGGVKNASKAVFTLTTFKDDGSLLASSHGVFIDDHGTALSDWKAFEGASRAVVVDASGKKMDVDCLLGVNDLYDVAKFRVKGKTTGAAIATTPASKGSKVWLVNYSMGKASAQEATVSSTETFMNKHTYYIFSMKVPDNAVSCPFVNDKGQVLGLLQQSKTSEDIHATGATFAALFEPSGMTINEPVLRSTSIRMGLPKDEDQALLAMMFAGHQYDSLNYSATVDDFIEQFPTSSEGYNAKAVLASNQQDFDGATRCMEAGIKACVKKDEAHFNYARLIYNKEVFQPQVSYPSWSMDKAMSEAEEAYRINPLPIYQHLMAQITYVKGDYSSAYDQFMALTHSDIRNPELFYEAAQSLQMQKKPREQVMALLDSAVVNCRKPYTTESAPFFLARAMALEEDGQYRKAIADYNQYDTLMVGQLGAEFYYQREQCELKGKLYQQALNDITRAIYLSPRTPLYYAEVSSLFLRLNKPVDALKAAEACLELDADNPDGHLLKGLALAQTGHKSEGLASLEKAKQLGNEQAQSFIDKYK